MIKKNWTRLSEPQQASLRAFNLDRVVRALRAEIVQQRASMAVSDVCQELAAAKAAVSVPYNGVLV